MYARLAGHISSELGWSCRVASTDSLTMALDSSHEHVCVFVCGLEMILYDRSFPNTVRPIVSQFIAAPNSSSGQLGCGYLSELVVHVDSVYAGFDSLRGLRFGYNEEKSHSGYLAVKDYLSRRGENLSFFGECVRTSSHMASLQGLHDSVIDMAAIDSQLLAFIRASGRYRDIAERYRTVDVIGPYPSPLMIAYGGVETRWMVQLRELLCELQVLNWSDTLFDSMVDLRFERVETEDYAQLLALHTNLRNQVGSDSSVGVRLSSAENQLESTSRV